MGLHVPGGGVPLDGRGTIQVTDIRLLVPSGLTFMKGGLDQRGCELRAEVVDIPRGILYMVPITMVGAKEMHKRLGDVIALIESKPDEESK